MTDTATPEADPAGTASPEAAAGADVDLSTTYMGLRLRTPIVASAGPLTGRIETLRALERAGVSAVVLPSLFEEQVVHDELQSSELFDLGAGANPEATSYFPAVPGYETVTERYVRHAEEAVAALSVPVVGSLNGASPGGWTRYAAVIADSGVDALELNLYRVAADPDVAGSVVEYEQLAVVTAVREHVDIPLAVKVGPFYTSFAHTARRFVDAGADALVLFNRFYQPDIVPDTRRAVPALELSTSAELRLPLRWVALLSGRLDASLALTTGVHTGLDVARALLAGADVAMMTSALLRHGPDHVTAVERELVAWAADGEFVSVSQLRGSASQRHLADPSALERANYIGMLVDYANSFHDAQGAGPW